MLPNPHRSDPLYRSVDVKRRRCRGPLPAVAITLTCLLSGAVRAEESSLVSLEGPDVVIVAGEDRTVYEYRQNGQLRMVKIVPKIGRPYYLVPADETRGFGDLEQAQTLIPRWVIVEF